MTKAEIIAALEAAEIEHDGRWSKERLAALLPDGEAVDAQEDVTVRCVIRNVWTSNGKLLHGETGEIPVAEFYDLMGKVELV